MISRKLPFLALSVLVPAALTAGWRGAAPGYPWSFPRDHWAHPAFRTEWWYFTGSLEDSKNPARRYGYQFTLFRVGLLPEAPPVDSRWTARQLLMGHAAVGDFQSGRHTFSDLLYREIPLLAGFGVYPDPLLAWSRAPAGTEGRWELQWNGEAFDFRMRDDERGIAFDLATHPLKPLVFQGPGGYSMKGKPDSAASLYYSLTRLKTSGVLTLEGRTLTVTGESWMDKEFGTSQLQPQQVGWDWFGLRLADGRDLMLYVLRRKDGAADFRKGTLISPRGDATYLTGEQWSVRPTASWKSSATGAVYPARWELEIPTAGLRLTIVPRAQDQENVGRRSAALHYWEGAVSLLGPEGEPRGEGTVELTGYGENNRPPL